MAPEYIAPEEYYTFTGRDGEVIPRHITHVLIEKVKFLPARSFHSHPNIQEVICHDGVEKIEEYAFSNCPSLRQVIMRGVIVTEYRAFNYCRALKYIECGELEIIGAQTFRLCESLSSIDLPSIKTVAMDAFAGCTNLTSAKFGKDLESIRAGVFRGCDCLERITLPLKEGMISDDDIFMECVYLNRVDLIGGVHETIDAFVLEEWKNDMNHEIDAISQILPSTPGYTRILTRTRNGYRSETGGKAKVMRKWIESVHRKYTHYKAEHCRYLNVKAALEPALPNDIVLNNVLPFLSKSFGRGEGE